MPPSSSSSSSSDSKPSGYRVVLARELEDRCRRNPRYSLRAYARDLGLQPGKLSEILRGRCGLSGALADRLADRLKLTPQEKRHFIALVESEHARSPLRRQQARDTLKTMESLQGFSELDLERFRALSDWQHFAIHELFLTKNFPGTAEAAAGRLRLTPVDAKDAMDRLTTIGLLRASGTGRWERVDASLGIDGGIPSREVRRHHRQILDKAAETLEASAVEERDFCSMTMAVPSHMLPRVREMVREFTHRLNREMEEAVDKDRVYCMNVNFFPLDRAEE